MNLTTRTSRLLASKPLRTASRKLHTAIKASGGPPPGALADTKVALITGGNTGIGFETAKALAKQGYYVVIACRDVDKANAAKAKILASVPNAKGVEVQNIDLADLESVRTFANKALDFGLPISVRFLLLHNTTPQIN